MTYLPRPPGTPGRGCGTGRPAATYAHSGAFHTGLTDLPFTVKPPVRGVNVQVRPDRDLIGARGPISTGASRTTSSPSRSVKRRDRVSRTREKSSFSALAM